MQQTREMAELGAHDPEMFRAHFRQQRPIDVPPLLATPTLTLPSATPMPSPAPSATASSAPHGTSQPQMTTTPSGQSRGPVRA